MLEIGKWLDTFEIKKKKIIFMFSSVFSYSYVKIYLLIFLLINGLIWIATNYIDSEIDEPQIALHYNVETGIDYYGDIEKIYVLPILGILIAFINFSLAMALSLHKDRKFILHILLSVAVLVNFILFAGVMSIYLVNFR